MLCQPYQLFIERTDATKNMARFYALAIEPTLFGTPCLTRDGGASGQSDGPWCITSTRKRMLCACFSICCG